MNKDTNNNGMTASNDSFNSSSDVDEGVNNTNDSTTNAIDSDNQESFGFS